MREYNMENPSYVSMAGRSSSGFTPINRNGAMAQFINPMNTLRHANESEPRHKLPDSANYFDEDPRGNEVLCPKPRKKRNKSVMLDLFQEGLDEIDGLAKRKRKPVQQRSKSAISPTRFSELVIEELVIPNNEGQETPLPALKTKSKSRAKSKTTSKNVPNTSEDKKHAPFKAPAITKPLPVEKVELTPVVARSFHVSNHPSLTTTESAFKNRSQGFLLSKTIMSKLHSFLYVPSIPHVASASSLPAQVAYPISELQPTRIEHTASEHDPDLNCDDVVLEAYGEDVISMQAGQAVGTHYSPDVPSAYAMLSSDNIFHGEPSWGHQDDKEQRFDPPQSGHWNEVVIPTERYDKGGKLAATQVNRPITPPIPSTKTQVTHSEPFQDLPVFKPDVHEPSSSEVIAYTQLLDQVERPPDENSVLGEQPPVNGSMNCRVEASNQAKDNRLDQHEVVFESYSNRSTRKEQYHGLLPPFTQNTHHNLDEEESCSCYHKNEPHLSAAEVLLFDDQKKYPFNSGANDEDMLYDDLLPSEVGDFEEDFDGEAMLLDNPMDSAMNEVGYRPDDDMTVDDHVSFEIEFGNGFDQVGPMLDDEKPLEIEFGDDLGIEAMLHDEPTPAEEKAVMNETATCDEFDDGLDDSELLEMLAANPIIVVKPPFIPNRDEKIPNGVSKPDAVVAVQQTRITNRPSPIVLPASNSPQTIDLDAEDEFPMDESDEEEMLKLPVLVPDTHRPGLSPPRLPGDRYSGSGEVWGCTTQLSPHKSLSRTPHQTQSSPSRPTRTPIASSQITASEPRSDMLGEGEESARLSTDQVQMIDITHSVDDLDEVDSENGLLMGPPPARYRSNLPLCVLMKSTTYASASKWEGSSDYQPIRSFARPDFPDTVRDRCPVIGLSGQSFVRTCFKIGEMFKEGKRCSLFGQDAIIELFARVTFSSREAGTTKQYFVFADLWRDNPPFPEGMLMNYKTTGLADTESKAFVNSREPKMARCLGRLKRGVKNATGWLLHIITIRETDWEEIRYTKKVVCASEVKSEPGQV